MNKLKITNLVSAAIAAANKAQTKKGWVANTAKELHVTYAWLIQRTSRDHLEFIIAMSGRRDWETFPRFNEYKAARKSQ
jgi:hypothetical protein